MTGTITVNADDPNYIARGEMVLKGVHWRIKADKYAPSEAIIERNSKYCKKCVSELPQPVRAFWLEVVQAAQKIPPVKGVY